jgi:hypothetical protein
MIRSTLAVVLAFAVAAMSAPLLAGCAPAVHPTAGQTNIPATSTPTTPQPTPTAVPGSTQTGVPAPPPPPPPGTNPACDSSKLQVSYIASNNNASGKFYGTLYFRNMSSVTCDAYGYPFVWFEADYQHVGAQATNIAGPAAQVLTLTPNQAMTSQIIFTDADLIDGCTVVQVTQLDVRPPGADNSIEVTTPETDTCSNDVQIASVGAAVYLK